MSYYYSNYNQQAPVYGGAAPQFGGFGAGPQFGGYPPMMAGAAAPATVVTSGAPAAAPVRSFAPAPAPYGGGFGGGFGGASYYAPSPYGAPRPYGAPGPYGGGSYGPGLYGHPGQRGSSPRRPGMNRGYYYDDYIHDRHSPRRSYARPRGFQDDFDGDVIYRQPITRDEDFVLPRRSPRSGASPRPATDSAAPAPASSSSAPAPAPAAVSAPSGPVTIEVVEAKELPTSILDKTDPYVVIRVAGQEFTTKHKDDAGKAARWNESFTVNNARAGTEGTIEVKDKDSKVMKDDAIGSTNFYLENGDRWYPLKPKGQVRLVVRGAY